jgi:hypothetical protein
MYRSLNIEPFIISFKNNRRTSGIAKDAYPITIDFTSQFQIHILFLYKKLITSTIKTLIYSMPHNVTTTAAKLAA